MVFSSLTFLFAYLPLTLLVYFLAPLKWRNLVLLVVSSVQKVEQLRLVIALAVCGITVAAVSAMPAYLKIGVRTFSAEPAALLPLKKLLMEQEI